MQILANFLNFYPKFTQDFTKIAQNLNFAKICFVILTKILLINTKKLKIYPKISPHLPKKATICKKFKVWLLRTLMKKRRKKINNIIILALIVVAVGLGIQLQVFERSAPVIYIQDTIYTNLQEPLPVRIIDEISGIKKVKITLKKDAKDAGVILYDEKIDKQKELVLEVKLPQIIKSTDTYTLEISAKDSSLWNFFQGNEALKNIPIVVDTQKPAVNILANSYQIEQGGAAAVVFEARDEHLQDLHIEDNKGRRFAVSPYLKDNHYAALVAWNAKEQDFRAFVIAKDKAGNITKERIRYYLINRKYRNSNIALKDGFLDGKIEDLAQQYAQNKNLARLEKFKFVNETLRLGNEERIHKVSAQAKKDYNGLQFTRFVPLKNAMKVGDFADHRFYSYKGEFVSESYHLGIDLASVARDNIYASLDGKVIFAEENGIYGINIIIDHGFGLYSLYGHCSSKLVAEGDEIKAGEIIAKTGTSGLALGDHLHFGILVQGVEVRPEQFQDAKWLQSYIISVLEEGRKIILKERK